MNQCVRLFKFTNRVPRLFFSVRKSTSQRGIDLAFGKYLLVTNTVASGLLFSLGDLIQQEIEFIKWKKHEDSFDWRRNIDMLLVGIIQGPMAHYFYKILDSKLPGKSAATIVKKVLLDEAIAAPLAISQFFLVLNALQGNSLKQGSEELRRKFLTVYLADCFWWIPIQILNFYVVAPKYRLLYINVMTMLYNAFLSFMKFTYDE